jgi:hypothetical protein
MPGRCWPRTASRLQPPTAADEAIADAEPENFSGKVVIDAMNPLDFSGGFPPKLSICGEDSRWANGSSSR